jgi:phosphoglycolate phosphatase-like HAD superfamily hydrolase
MISLSSRQLKRVRGIIVWDFDRVLFDTDRFYRGAEKIFKKFGVPPQALWAAVLKVRRDGDYFSVARVLRILREMGYAIPDKKIRKEIHNHLRDTKYFPQSADALLHRLRKRGILHIILSHSSSSYLRKKIKVGCGERFLRNFVKIYATRISKYILLKKLSRRFSLPIFFVDDDRRHIELVKEHARKINALHYAKGWSLKKVERTVIASLKK